MHTVKLEMGDGIYSHIMFLLKNLNSNELKIIEESKSTQELHEIDDLETKMFSNHSTNLIEDWKDIAEDEVWR